MTDSIKVPEGYSCVRIMSSGGTVVVVEMIEKSTNIHYTGKIVQCLTQNDIDQFNREVKILTTFDHPRIIKLKEVITMDNIKVMVMELGGTSLADVVQDYTKRKVLLPRDEVYRVMEDISSALEMMHNSEGGRTAHGDIKMANILIGRDDHAKLCYFGVTESEEVSLTQLEMPQLYVSPERLESETGEATCEADVWSLGVILFWLLFGEPPFKAKNPVHLIRDITSFRVINVPNSRGEEERALLMRIMDPCAESRITCRQLRLSKSFQCIVNTIDGVWKLKNDEQALRVEAEEKRRKTEEEKLLTEEKLKRAELERARMEDEKKKAEAARARMEEEKKKAEMERARMEDEKKKAEAARARMEEEKKKAEMERARMEDEKKKAEMERARMEDEKKKAEAARARMEEEKKKAEMERARMEDEKKKAEMERARMEDEKTKAEEKARKAEEEKGLAEEKLKNVEEPREQSEKEKEKLSDEVKRTLKELEDARTENEKSGREKRELSEKMDRMRMMLRTEWIGTESLHTLDRSVHTLTPSSITQIAKLKKSDKWRTAFTFPIDEGEWEFKIRRSEQTEFNVSLSVLILSFSELGFFRHPIPSDAVLTCCGRYSGGIGGDFNLFDGTMLKAGKEYKPTRTNKICDRVGQTAAIRVNMSTRNARLLVDDEEQPGIFTDIPSPLCLGISTHDQNTAIEVLHLARIDIIQTEQGKQALSMTDRIKELEQEVKKAEEQKGQAEREKEKMEEEKKRTEENTRRTEEGKRIAEERQKKAEEQTKMAERENEKLTDDVKRTLIELKEVREKMEKSEREKREMVEKMERMRATVPTVWVGTDALQIYDRTAHALNPTTLTQIVKLEKNTDWRTAFTFPIDEGEWELKIRGNDTSWFVSVFFSLLIFSVLGFLKHPLPDNAIRFQCGSWKSGIGGDFHLFSGRMWKGGEFKPAGTNKKWDRVGQTAAIRVNMTTREARLFVDDEEQPGIFTDIPSPLCLGISTGFLGENHLIEVHHLARTDVYKTELEKQQALSKSTRIFSLEEENLKAEEKMERMRMMLRTEWIGTESLKSFDRTAHRLTPTTLTQIIKLEPGNWRSAFTLPIDEGEWELKIRGNDTPWVVSVFFSLLIVSDLGFLKHPLPQDAPQHQCGSWKSGIGGDFVLWDGRMWTGGKEFKPAGTNKKWDRVGQTAAIRVNMSTREARLFVDDEEQPGIFTDIPSPLCLGISTGFPGENKRIEILHVARTDIIQTEQGKQALSMTARIKELEQEVKKAEEQKGQTEREKENLSDEVKKIVNELKDVREKMENSEREKIEMAEKLERMRNMLRTEWVGTESLRTFDRSVHTLTPNSITQIIKLETAKWRTAFTLPIDEGEWELKIRGNDTLWNVMLGFLRHTLPQDATRSGCGSYFGGIGGHFSLWKGGLWKGGNEFKPAGTNKKCDRVGQTAAIRVNMTTREARLFVDDEEQPGIFTDIPSPLCLAISTHDQNAAIEILHLTRTDIIRAEQRKPSLSLTDRIKELEQEMKKAEEQKGQTESEKEKLSDEVKRTVKELQEMREEKLRAEEKVEWMRMMLRTEWAGTESLKTFDRTAHRLTSTTLTQIVPLEKRFSTAMTFPIDEGEWELKVRQLEQTGLMLGFIGFPLPQNTTPEQCGGWISGIGGHFFLWDGGLWKEGKEFKPAGTNKKCDHVGQTAAIRVNMTTREARLFVDDEEQPGIFTDIPSPLYIGITTYDQTAPIEVLHLARTDILKMKLVKQQTLILSARMKELEEDKKKTEEKLERMRMMLRTEWIGTESLHTLDDTAHTLTPNSIAQIIKLKRSNEWRTAFTFPIDDGEWEFKIRGNGKAFLHVTLGFLSHPLPKDATQRHCGNNPGMICGDFLLWDGRMWKGGEFKPAGTNKKCDRIWQTAAIRVNMSTREARLLVDDEEQPGIFTDIPSPLCLGISTHEQKAHIKILHLARLGVFIRTEPVNEQTLSPTTRILTVDEKQITEKERAKLEETREGKEECVREDDEMSEKMKQMKMMMGQEWTGEEALKTFDNTVHQIKGGVLTQIVNLDKNTDWRTAFTFPIDEGDWELKIRGNDTSWIVILGFLKHPLPENAIQRTGGTYHSGIGGDFILWDGKMWKGGEFKPAGTNKKCDRVGQTAAIRVNMSTREARLFVDDEEQPGIFTDIPSPLCLGITTQNQNAPIEVHHLTRTDCLKTVET
ncbi:putative Protein kinase domain containing protein [Blattamonas nauphoetae]|uniref:Protein kinase domain-containing protein n=1 Tax=Blattamonas nauphoetae TaxID=2049346 RepID=A0ABQ9WV93_9EUKA|nr:putative Protein kinase domain containing protein [Blattamonas nauphoetae]